MAQDKFIKRVSNGVLFPFAEYGHLAGTDGYQVCDVNGLSFETVVVAGVESIGEVDQERLMVLCDAILQIDPSTFNKATASSPAMPKVAAVSALIGGSVTAAEIKTAVLSMG